MRTVQSPRGLCTENKKEWNSWRAAKMRCRTKSYHKYHLYGGRGIKVCDRWLGCDGFVNFLQDMGKKPTPKHSLDRINTDGDYEPSNCKWSTQREQMNNMSRNILVEVSGVTDTFVNQARRHDINLHTVMSRLYLDWPIEKAFTTPTKGIGANQTTYKGVL